MTEALQSATNLEAQPEVSPEQMLDVLLVHLICASQQSVGRPSLSRDYVAEHFPASMTLSNMHDFSGKVISVVYETNDPRQSDREAMKVAARTNRRVLSWLGELSCHTGALGTAHSAEQELRQMGGLANRRASRKLKRTIANVDQLPALLYSHS